MGDETVWTGAVEVFELEGNELSKLCYAWCEKVNSREQRFVTILQKGLIITPANAVHAWLATRPVVVHPVAYEPALPKEILEAVLPAEDENRHTKSVSTIDLARSILGLGEPAQTCHPPRYSSSPRMMQTTPSS